MNTDIDTDGNALFKCGCRADSVGVVWATCEEHQYILDNQDKTNKAFKLGVRI